MGKHVERLRFLKRRRVQYAQEIRVYLNNGALDIAPDDAKGSVFHQHSVTGFALSKPFLRVFPFAYFPSKLLIGFGEFRCAFSNPALEFVVRMLERFLGSLAFGDIAMNDDAFANVSVSIAQYRCPKLYVQ